MKNYPKYTVEAKKIKGIENETVTTPKLKGFLMAVINQKFKYRKCGVWRKRCDVEIDHPMKYLLDWFIRYTKNRDLVFRKISDVKEEANKAIVAQKDGRTIHYYSVPFPEDIEKTAASLTEEHKGLVVYNTKENFDNLAKAWKKLAEIKNLTIYFVNPFSKTDKKWIINPHVHNAISDSASLKQGLVSMYMMVDPTTKEEVERLTK